MNPPTPSLIAAPNSARPQVACYYFPNYHVDVRNQPVHGQGWSEWELVKAATPRWPGHSQPNLPLWGYTDEADPVQMGQKIAAAADHGIDAFIFDWYWYNDVPILQRALDEGLRTLPERSITSERECRPRVIRTCT